MKHRLIFNGLHGVITEKIEIFINTVVRTSNPAFHNTVASYGEEILDTDQPSSLRVICCGLSPTANSIYSQPPSMSGDGVLNPKYKDRHIILCGRT
jgi:hypothetical protein